MLHSHSYQGPKPSRTSPIRTGKATDLFHIYVIRRLLCLFHAGVSRCFVGVSHFRPANWRRLWKFQAWHLMKLVRADAPTHTIESANIAIWINLNQFDASSTLFLQDPYGHVVLSNTSVEVEQLLEAGAFLLELLSQRPPRFATSLPQQWVRWTANAVTHFWTNPWKRSPTAPCWV